MVKASRSSSSKMSQLVLSKQSCSCEEAPSGQVFTVFEVTLVFLLRGVYAGVSSMVRCSDCPTCGSGVDLKTLLMLDVQRYALSSVLTPLVAHLICCVDLGRNSLRSAWLKSPVKMWSASGCLLCCLLIVPCRMPKAVLALASGGM